MKEHKQYRKYIIFGGDGINPLGIVRSLGEVGIESDIIRFRESAHLATIETSKYVRNAYYGDTNEELLTILLRICLKMDKRNMYGCKKSYINN